MNLATSKPLCYSAGVTKVIGFCSPERRRNRSRAHSLVSGFSFAQHGSAYGGACGEGESLAGPSSGLQTSHVLPPLFCSGGDRFTTCREGAIMADSLVPSGTPAHYPSVFTTNETALITCALNLIEEKRLKNAPVLHYMQDFERYLRLRFAGLSNEQGHTLYLNVNRELLSAETEFFGNQKSVSWDIRKTVARAIQLGAEFVVVAHNHPNNNPDPSEADLSHLDWLETTFKPFGIDLLDSFVVTSKEVTSIKTIRQNRKDQQDRDRLHRWERERVEKRARREANRIAKLSAQQTQGETA